MHRKELKRSPVVSVIMGAITFYALYSISSLTPSIVILIAATVAILSYFKPASSSFALTALIVLPAIYMITGSGIDGSQLSNLGLFCLVLFFGAFMMDLTDWFGAIVGI